MKRNRSVVKPVTDLWRRGVTIALVAKNLCTFFRIVVCFSQVRYCVLIYVQIPAILEGVHSISLSHILFVKKSEQMSIWFDFCELKFNTISIVQRLPSVNILSK
jgi:methylaspartate ammonia-lyase